MASTIKPIIPPGLYRETIDTAGAPGGASGTLQYNNGGAFGGITGWTTNGTTGLTGGAGTTLAVGNAAIGSNVLAVGGASLFTGVMVNSANGALSAPVLSLTGTAITGGTGTTTKPLALIETTGATSNNWNTSGTYLGVNAANGFTGYLLDLQTNGTRAFAVDRVGQCLFSTQISGPSYYESSGNTFYANSSAGGVQTKQAGFFGFSTTANAFDTVGARILSGANTPESAVTAAVGSLFLRTNGGAGTTLYVKESGAGNTGWVAVVP